MNNRFLNILFPAIGTVLIPQLLFFWADPAAPCRMVVYLFGTLITLANAGLCLWCFSRFGLRRAAGMIALACAMALTSLVLCGLLLVLQAHTRTAIFACGIAAVLFVTSMIPMIGTAEPDGQVSSRYDRSSWGRVQDLTHKKPITGPARDVTHDCCRTVSIPSENSEPPKR